MNVHPQSHRNWDCATFAARLDEYLGFALAPPLRAAAEFHLAGCPACQELLETARENRAVLTGQDEEDLTAAILARTSGSACHRAEELLADHVDRRLARSDADLVAGHLEHCAPCRSVAEALDWVLPLLPEFARFDPGPEFTAGVLRQTTPSRQTYAARGTVRSLDRGTGGVRRRPTDLFRRGRGLIARRWSQLWQRPRFALEAAYAATLLIVALCATPISPLREAPPLALEAIQAGPQGWSEVQRVAGDVGGRGARFGDAIFGGVRARVDGVVSGVTGDLDRRNEQARPAWQKLQQRGRRLGEQVRSGDIGQGGATLKSLFKELPALWSAWIGEEPPAEEIQIEPDTAGSGTAPTVAAGSQAAKR